MWTLITPVGAIEAEIWTTSKASPQHFGESYARGKFDFDNDGVPDVVYRTSGGYSTSYFLIKAQQTSESRNMSLDSSKEAEEWPQDFGIEWLEQESDRVFPSMWANCPPEKEGCGGMGRKFSHDYEIKHRKGSQLMYLDFYYIGFTLFRYRDITYLLASPSYLHEGIEVLFRPRPDKTVDEVCVFRLIP